MIRTVTLYCRNCGRQKYEVEPFSEALHCRSCGTFLTIPAPGLWFKIRVWFRKHFPKRQPLPVRIKRRRSAVLPGEFARSPGAELYTRPDKDNPAREWWKNGQAWERLEGEGKTKKLDDWDGRKAQIESWQKVGYGL